MFQNFINTVVSFVCQRSVSGLPWVTDECQTLRRPDTQRGVASCRQFCFQFRYVGLSCDLVWTVLSVGNMSLALFLVSLLQFLCKTLHVAL